MKFTTEQSSHDSHRIWNWCTRTSWSSFVSLVLIYKWQYTYKSFGPIPWANFCAMTYIRLYIKWDRFGVASCSSESSFSLMFPLINIPSLLDKLSTRKSFITAAVRHPEQNEQTYSKYPYSIMEYSNTQWIYVQSEANVTEPFRSVRVWRWEHCPMDDYGEGSLHFIICLI